MLENPKKIWLTWETQRRNVELSLAFGALLGQFDYSALPALLRYSMSAAKTFGMILRERPRLVIVQCPSIVLLAYIFLLQLVFRFKIVIDAHNAAVEYLLQGASPVGRLVATLFRRADGVIVSNESLARKLDALEINRFVLPDAIPKFSSKTLSNPISSEVEVSKSRGILIVTLICSFAADEPIREFLSFVKSSSARFRIFCTGKVAMAGSLTELSSERIVFTDFLSNSDYDALLQSSDLLVDLTTREDCLVCGAFEALAAKKPILLSDTPALREAFGRTALFSKNDRESYRIVVESFISNRKPLSEQLGLGIDNFRTKWHQQFKKVNAQIDLLLSQV